MTMIELSPDFQWGPRMAALTPQQRRYVMAMASDPFGNPTQWARLAGYSDVKEAAKVRGHELSHNPEVEKAVQEFSKTALGTLGPMLATAGLLRIARSKSHPDHLKALLAIANRAGLHETTEHRVQVQHTDLTGQAIINRIAALAAKHGLDQAKLIGGNTIEATAVEVKPDEQ
jgi:hypothetical protein